jgi:hypothetical protein
MSAQAEAPESYLVVINRPGPNWETPLPATAEMAASHHAIYQELLEDGLLISAGRLDGTPVMGISLFHQGADEQAIREKLDSDEFVTRGYLTLEYRNWQLLSGSLAGLQNR